MFAETFFFLSVYENMMMGTLAPLHHSLDGA